jgi:hypothetical protein
MADLEHVLVAAIERTLNGMQGAVNNMGDKVTGLGREVSGMSAKLDGICTTVKEHSEAIRALQIADATGQVDVAEQRAKAAAEQVQAERATAERVARRRAAWLPVIVKIAPWLMAVLIGIGAYFGNGNDNAANANAIRYLVDTVRAMEADMDKIKLEDHLALPEPGGME